jgi:hypothetical protein
MLNLAASIFLVITCLLLARVIVQSKMIGRTALPLTIVCSVLLALSMTALSLNLWRLTQI